MKGKATEQKRIQNSYFSSTRFSKELTFLKTLSELFKWDSDLRQRIKLLQGALGRLTGTESWGSHGLQAISSFESAKAADLSWLQMHPRL